MENKLLQPLLQAGLLDIGDSDERLANIEKSIVDLQKKLDENRPLLPVYTLVALDPEIQDSEQVLIDTEALVAFHWKALRAKFSERPIPVLRAVILNALYNLGVDDSYIARVIYLTARNYYPYCKLGREKEIVDRLFEELGDLAEKNAVEEWALSEESPAIKVGALKINGLQFGEIAIDNAKLKANLKTAAGRTPEGHNPYNHPEEWGTHFSKKAGDGIANVLTSLVKDLETSLSPTSIETPINKFFSEFKKSLDQTLKSSFNSIVAVDRRSKLLWWKETLYSSSLKNSYRTLSQNVQPIVMAFDLYEQLPEITPASVDFLLRDTLLLLNPNASEQITFSDFLSELLQEKNQTLLKNYFIEEDKGSGRISITDFFSQLVYGKVKSSAFKTRTGIDDSYKTSLTELSVAILHDLLTQYLVKE